MQIGLAMDNSNYAPPIPVLAAIFLVKQQLAQLANHHLRHPQIIFRASDTAPTNLKGYALC